MTAPLAISAVAWAGIAIPGPVGASTVTTGGEVYPDPPLVTKISLTTLYFLSK